MTNGKGALYKEEARPKTVSADCLLYGVLSSAASLIHRDRQQWVRGEELAFGVAS